MSIEACRAGKDVYVEKPVCVAIDEDLKVVEAVRRTCEVCLRLYRLMGWQQRGSSSQRMGMKRKTVESVR